MDIKTKSKKAVLEEIIGLMDERMDGELKRKSPKFKQLETEPSEPIESSEEMQDYGSDDEDESIQKLIEMYKKIKG